MQCKMCSEHNKLTIVHLIRIWRTFRSTQQPLLYTEVGKDCLSSHISSEGVDALSCLKDSQLKIGSYVSVRSSRYEARGKFGEHERYVRYVRYVLLEWKMFFLEGFACWRHERTQWEYEARSRNWIWLHKFTGYVIILSWNIIDVLRTEKIYIGMRRWDGTLWILNAFSLETGKEQNFSSNQNCVENSLSVASSPMWYFFSGVGYCASNTW